MKKVTLVIDENTMADLGLTNSSDDAAVGVAIKNALNKAKKVDDLQNKLDVATQAKSKAESDLVNYKQEQTTLKVKAMLTNALDAKKLTKEVADQFETDYAGNPEGLEKVLNAMKPYTPIANQVKPEGEPKNKLELVKEYDEKFLSGELEELKNSNPEHYNALKEAKFPK